MDFILNNAAHGDVAGTLLQHNFDPGAMRPWLSNDEKDKQTYVTLNQEGKQTVLATNAPATLRVREWIEIDRNVQEAVYTTPQRMFADLRASGSNIIIPNGMGKTVLEYERMTDIGDAITSMDGIRESDGDRPHFDVTGMPLPIVHKDFQFTARQIAVSRNGGSPLDMTMPRLAARKCMEQVEKYTAGSQTYKYGGYNVYGYTNYPQRLTQSITAPSSSNHPTTVAEILAMRKKLTDRAFTGPYMVYMSPAWDAYLDEDYSDSTAKTGTLRERIQKIKGISGVEVSYYLSGNAIVMVQMTPDVAQAVVGMDVMTLQWPSKGGMLINFKVLCILLPRMKSDINGLAGIVHGS